MPSVPPNIHAQNQNHDTQRIPAARTRNGNLSRKSSQVIRDAHEEFSDEKRLEIVKEIGDVLWYCATLARDLGYELDDVAQMNVDKLRSRMQRNHLTGSGDNR